MCPTKKQETRRKKGSTLFSVNMMLAKQPAGNLSKCLVACNIYVSAGQPRAAPILLGLLNDAQDLCRRSKKSRHDKIIIAHAFADGPYDRSSFHIAGSPNLVTEVASTMSVSAIKTLSDLRQAAPTTVSGDHAHPTVGLVDHVAVLPLSHNEESFTFQEWIDYLGEGQNEGFKNDEYSLPSKMVPSGWVARGIGKSMESIGVNVFFYGHVHPNQTPLATVRRDLTKFFKRLPNKEENDQGGQATVGAPMHFVENYNVRLKSECTREVARSLTKYVRERDGGLPFVEALTLKYSQNRYEVACNLLHPRQTSSSDVASKVKEWEECHGNLVETSYSVGTTEQYCMEALEQSTTPTSEEEYNRKVREHLQGYLARGINF